MIWRAKKSFLSCAFIVLLLAAGVAYAKGPAKVANGVHNLSKTGIFPDGSSSWYATDESSICVFCHTPHGGTTTGPLWNKNNPSSTWRHYNSATIHSTIKALGAGRVPNDESLVCLSCHDGSVSVNHVLNPPNGRTTPITTTFSGSTDEKIVGIPGVVGARTGGSTDVFDDTGDFRDDHPFSFSYTAVQTSTEYTTGGKKDELKSVVDAQTAGVRFYGAANNVECSSCHDPHVNYKDNPEYTPFLIMSNEGSAMCLACHTK